MTIEVQVDGVGVLEFPDGTDKSIIKQTVNNVIAKGGKGAPIPSPTLGNTFPSGQAALIASGRTMDKIAQGNKQLGLNAMVAGKEALGMDSRPQLDALNQQAEVERGNDVAYDGLRKQFPLATGAGENALLMAAPVGQATAAARIGVPAIASALSGGLQYGSPEERTVKAVAGGAAGAAGGAAGEASAFLVNPVRNAMKTPAQEAAKAAADKIGAPLLPSQQTGSESLARVEDMLARYPGSSGVMRGFIDKQQGAVNRSAQRSIGEDRPLTQQVLGEAKKRMGGEYDNMRGQIPGMPAVSPVFDAIDKAEKMLTNGSRAGKEGALGMLQELRDKLYSTKQLNPDEYQGWVSDIATAARETKNMTIAAALKSVGREMDTVARGPLAKEWGQLDQRYGNLKSLMKPGMVNDATGDVYTGRLANQIERKGGEALKTGKMDGEFADIYNFHKSVPHLREGSPTAERQAAASTMQWLLAPARYGAAKGLTSDMMREYLAKGLLASPEASGLLGGALQSGALPLASGAVNLGLLNFLSQ